MRSSELVEMSKQSMTINHTTHLTTETRAPNVNSIDTTTVSTFHTDISNTITSEEATFSVTTLPETGNTNATVPGDQSEHTSIVIYVMVPVAVLIVLEFFIFIVLLRRCYAKKNANKGIYSKHNSDSEEDKHSIFAVENKAYTGFVLHETETDDNIITGNPKHNTDVNEIKNIRTGEQRQKRIDPGYLEVKIEPSTEAEQTEQQWQKRIDPGYLEVKIGSPEVTETENCHRIKSRATEFVNRTYSHFEGPRVDLGEGDDNYNRLHFNRQTGAINTVQVETESENDTEYDHTSSVRKRQPIQDDTNYSHVSIVTPRPQSSLCYEEDVKVRMTRPNKPFMHDEFTKPHTSDTKRNYEKRKTSVDQDIRFQQNLMSSVETKHKSLYSEVIKDIDKKRHENTTRKHNETEKSKLDDKSREMEYEYTQVVKKTKYPVRNKAETANPLAEDNQACFTIGDKNDFDGSKKNQNHDYINIVKQQ